MGPVGGSGRVDVGHTEKKKEASTCLGPTGKSGPVEGRPRSKRSDYGPPGAENPSNRGRFRLHVLLAHHQLDDGISDNSPDHMQMQSPHRLFLLLPPVQLDNDSRKIMRTSFPGCTGMFFQKVTSTTAAIIIKISRSDHMQMQSRPPPFSTRVQLPQ